ncbi:dienelactone hydrolase family protein, partial [Burkholderia sp. Ax-1720]|uniref:dienelactone hydrolase family protein n=1 Tax=Burkholderia sp. Ax-1720 TaxID=2608335 RepID=UPI0031F519B5
AALRARPEVEGKVAGIGYCFGGRLAYLAAASGASAPPAFAADPWPIPGRFRATLPLAGQPAAIPSLPLFPPRASFGSRRAGRAGTRFDPVIAFSRFAGYIFRISGRHGGGIP